MFMRGIGTVCGATFAAIAAFSFFNPVTAPQLIIEVCLCCFAHFQIVSPLTHLVAIPVKPGVLLSGMVVAQSTAARRNES
jgi:hypothetical protein